MTDLTVLHASKPLYPLTHGLFNSSTPRLTPQRGRPPQLTFQDDETQEPVRNEISGPSPRRNPRPDYDSSFLTPPVNTWKSPNRQRRHRPTRSLSAPPGDRKPKPEVLQITTASDDQALLLAFKPPNSRPLQPKRSYSSFATIGTSRTGELLPPPPPLLRPTTFWRKTRRSGVAGASYSPSSHLIRRSTYIAAGLRFDSPTHDLSALCVESRVGCIVIPPEFTFSPN